MNAILPKAIFFDLDDTILFYSSETDVCWDRACRECVAGRPGPAADSVLTSINEVRHWFWSDPERHRQWRVDMVKARRKIVSLALEAINVQDPALAERIADSYSAQREESYVLFPGATETLVTLREQGVALALLTNGGAGAQWGKIERFRLAPFFDCIVVEGEFGVGKPDERVYRHALAALTTQPEDTWMVGDNLEWDVAALQLRRPPRLPLRDGGRQPGVGRGRTAEVGDKRHLVRLGRQGPAGGQPRPARPHSALD